MGPSSTVRALPMPISPVYIDSGATTSARYLPIIEQHSESAFRLQLIRDLLAGQGVDDVSEAAAQALQDNFDSDRLEAFDFYLGIAKFLADANSPIVSEG
jgi:N-acylneuraminate-9-phosphatase